LFLIEALRGTETKIVLIGPSFDAAYLAMCRARGGDDVIYVDRVSQDMVASAYKAARVHVLPSYAEGAAMANLEAAAAGCPIVVSNRSSEFEYFGDLACYCDPVDPDSIRAAVAQAWRGREAEPERWSDLAAAMRAHSWQNAADATLAAYRRVLARSRR
jgi:glycosyltransferase involved in cell wall biosynthesis